MLKYRNDGRCQVMGSTLTTLSSLLLGHSVALAQAVMIQHVEGSSLLSWLKLYETTGGWPSADDGPYAWGYCFIRENDRQTQCSSDQWPCPAGMQYYGRAQFNSLNRAANRVPGYGVITNIINGGLECGSGANDKVADRIGFYKRYCDLLGVSYGDNLDCYNQRPFA
uniref:Glycoside hydrolase family 19 catalytic domain-containing protein n=1 Tax=Salix viminalis TaxID=40686 RepID=A0A6N2M0E3_SALVM